MSRHLYEISNDMVELFNQVDPETGELPPQLSLVTAEFATKAHFVVAHILNEQADMEKLEELLKKITAKHKRIKSGVEWFKKYLFENMQRTGITKIEANDLSFTAVLHKNRDEYIDVYDAELLEEKYMRVIPQKMEPNKVEIKNALKAGEEVEGARLVKKDRLVIK